MAMFEHIMNMSSVEASTAYAYAEHGVEIAPSDGETHRAMYWIRTWRTAVGAEEKRFWVRTYVHVAVVALNSGLLRPEELPLIRHEIIFMHDEGEIPLDPENKAAWEETYMLWDGSYWPCLGCDCVRCARHAAGLITPDASPQPVLPLPSQAEQAEQPEQPKKRRGRPPGAKDLAKRATRGELNGLTIAQISARNRNGPTAIRRRAEAKRQKQQQQTPPA